ncbi:MAG: FmdB family zinc ribbon protein [Candidatus Zipacnadales bacterium]
MPLYEYQCLDCGTISEVLVPRGTKGSNCPHCGSKNTRKTFSVFAISSPPCPSERKCETDGPRNTCPMSGQCRITS